MKGGVVLAAFGERRPTRDIDLQAETLDNDSENIRTVICEIAARRLDDGVIFDVETATTVAIRDEDAYGGVRVTMSAHLATARPHFHVDLNVGDPITPIPQELHLPRPLGGDVILRGYPLVMVHAEKIVTAVARGTVNTRWRDFADIYLLSRRHPLAGADLGHSVHRVAHHRQVQLVPLARVLDGYGETGQTRWAAWEESSNWRTASHGIRPPAPGHRQPAAADLLADLVVKARVPCFKRSPPSPQVGGSVIVPRRWVVRGGWLRDVTTVLGGQARWDRC